MCIGSLVHTNQQFCSPFLYSAVTVVFLYMSLEYVSYLEFLWPTRARSHWLKVWSKASQSLNIFSLFVFAQDLEECSWHQRSYLCKRTLIWLSWDGAEYGWVVLIQLPQIHVEMCRRLSPGKRAFCVPAPGSAFGFRLLVMLHALFLSPSVCACRHVEVGTCCYPEGCREVMGKCP